MVIDGVTSGAAFIVVTGKDPRVAMKNIQRIIRRFNRRSGQSLVEYALILALIAIVAVLVLRGIGSSVNNKLANVNDNFN